MLMQTLSGVTDDGREVIAAVAPGKFSAGSSVAIEAQHVVEKPAGLDWERAAILPFLVSTGVDLERICELLHSPTMSSISTLMPIHETS